MGSGLADWRPRPGMTTRREHRLRTIAAIDVDIAVGEVAGPHRRLARAEADVDGDVDLAALHMLGDRPLVVIGHRPAIGGDLNAADGDTKPVAIGLFAGPADRHDDAAPIRVARGERGLDQRRVADRQADLPRGPVAPG